MSDLMVEPTGWRSVAVVQRDGERTIYTRDDRGEYVLSGGHGEAFLRADVPGVRKGSRFHYQDGFATIEGRVTRRYRRRDGTVHLWWEADAADVARSGDTP